MSLEMEILPGTRSPRVLRRTNQQAKQRHERTPMERVMICKASCDHEPRVSIRKIFAPKYTMNPTVKTAKFFDITTGNQSRKQSMASKISSETLEIARSRM